MLESLKHLFDTSPPVVKMAGASLTIFGPLPSTAHVYELERAIQKLKLTGWMRVVNWTNVEMEVYGAYQTINDLLKQIDQGKIFQKNIKYEMMWLPYNSTFPAFSQQLFEKTSKKYR